MANAKICDRCGCVIPERIPEPATLPYYKQTLTRSRYNTERDTVHLCVKCGDGFETILGNYVRGNLRVSDTFPRPSAEVETSTEETKED